MFGDILSVIFADFFMKTCSRYSLESQLPLPYEYPQHSTYVFRDDFSINSFKPPSSYDLLKLAVGGM